MPLPGRYRSPVDTGSHESSFLGGRRRLPTAGIEVARRAGAALLPVFLLRNARGYVIKVHPPLSNEGDLIAAYARVLEGEVMAHPAQWCILYPVHEETDAQPSAAEMP